MSGIANNKFTMNDLKKLSAYALQQRIEPLEVQDKEQAKALNKQEQLISRLLGIPIYHTWEPGDRFYNIPTKAIYEKQDPALREIRENNNMDSGRPHENTEDNSVDPQPGKEKRGVAEKVVRKVKKK